MGQCKGKQLHVDSAQADDSTGIATGCYLLMEKTSGIIMIIVRNTCEPTSEEDIQKIFEPFFRVQGESPRGTGIGLAITKKIVDKHKGNLMASYSQNRLTIEMSLPERPS